LIATLSVVAIRSGILDMAETRKQQLKAWLSGPIRPQALFAIRWLPFYAIPPSATLRLASRAAGSLAKSTWCLARSWCPAHGVGTGLVLHANVEYCAAPPTGALPNWGALGS
jgi:hypothetical protein